MKGLELKKIRRGMGLTQGDLAEALNLTTRTIIKLEKMDAIPENKVKLIQLALNDLSEGEGSSQVNEVAETYKQEKPSTEELLRVINNKLDMYFQQSQDQRAAIAEASKITVENTDKLLLDTMEINRTINDTSQKFERLFRLLDDRRKF